MGRTNLVRNRVAELNKKKHLCQKHKKEIIDFLQKQKDRFLNREITSYEFDQIANEKSNGKTPSGWIEYYDWYVLEIEKRIKIENNILNSFVILS